MHVNTCGGGAIKFFFPCRPACVRQAEEAPCCVFPDVWTIVKSRQFSIYGHAQTATSICSHVLAPIAAHDLTSTERLLIDEQVFDRHPCFEELASRLTNIKPRNPLAPHMAPTTKNKNATSPGGGRGGKMLAKSHFRDGHADFGGPCLMRRASTILR